MKIRRCALVAAVIMAVCAVVFLCQNKSSDGMVKSVSGEQPAAAVPSSAVAAVAASMPVQLSSNQTATVRGTKPYVLTCERNFNQSLRLAAEALGMRTVSVLGRKSLLVEATPAVRARLAADGRFSSVEEFLPSDKVDPDLAALISAGAKDVEVTVAVLAAEDRETLRARIVAQGGTIVPGCLNGANSFTVRVPAEFVSSLAGEGAVRWIEKFDRPRFTNDMAVEPAAMNVRGIWKSMENPGGLSGAGQIVSTSDSGIDTGDLETMHKDLRNQICGMTNVEGCVMHDGLGHGTHTAGSIVGDGTCSDGKIRGTAWGAKLYAWFCGKDNDRGVYTPGNPADLFRPDHENFPTYIHSASWGSDTAGKYVQRCEIFDAYVWENPDFLPVFSAGNSGSGLSTVGSPGAAKNVLTVGATQNVRTHYPANDHPTGNPVQTASFSSRGPCADGRVKPDVAAPGVGILSTRAYACKYSRGVSDDKNYAYECGTSMSCPLTAGAMALVREWLVENPGKWKAEGAEEVPTAALMKAIVTGGARGGSRPSNDQGWGRVDIAETLFPSNRAVRLIDRIPFAQDADFAWVVETTNAAPLDVQLAWIDAPGEGLVNDLDLTVEPLDGDLGAVYYGNGGTSADTVNNLESVRVSAAAPGRYLVSVSCSSILFDHTEGGAAALYVRGAFDPETVREGDARVRIRETGKGFQSLDRALTAVDGLSGAVTLEVLSPVSLKGAYGIPANCTITATNDDPLASAVMLAPGASLSVANGRRLVLTNLVFSGAADTLVSVGAGGTLALAGHVDFGLPSNVASVRTEDADGLVLLAPCGTKGFGLACAQATEVGTQFGNAFCDDFAAVSNLAAKIANVADPTGELRGKAVPGAGGFTLEWDVLPVPLEDAVGYVVDSENGTNTKARIDRLFEQVDNLSAAGRLPDSAEIVIRRVLPGDRLSRTVRVGQNVILRSSAGDLAVDCSAGGGFVVTNGTLAVSDLAFTDHRGDGTFVVEGGELVLSNAVISRAIGTSKWAGAVAVKGGKATLVDTLIENCGHPATTEFGFSRSQFYGGGVYLARGTEATFDGCTITNCQANVSGGGIYAENGTVKNPNGARVRVKGALTVRDNLSGANTLSADDIFIGGTNGTELAVVGALSGSKTIGVRYGTTGGYGNGISNVFAKLSAEGIDAAASAAAFFPDSDPVGLKAEAAAAEFRWIGDFAKKGSETDSPEMTVVVSNCVDNTVLYYDNVADAFEGIHEASSVALRGKLSFDADLVVSNEVCLTADPGFAGSAIELDRATNCSIRVKSGGWLTVRDCWISGSPRDDAGVPTWITCSVPLIAVEGGALTLDESSVVGFVLGDNARTANAVWVTDGGMIVMKSGSEICNSMNRYARNAENFGWGGGLLVEGSASTARLEGGSIRDCYAVAAGGAFIGSKSQVFVSGDMRIEGNTARDGYDPDGGIQASDLIVADQSGLVLDGPFTGAVGCLEGIRGDTNVFGRVSADLALTDDVISSATNFWHDVRRVRGVVATNAESAVALLVWSDAFTGGDGNWTYEAPDGKGGTVVYRAAMEKLPPPMDGPGPDPEYVDPDPIAFKSITRVSDTEWVLVVTDAVKWCNYSLFATNTLEGGFVITNSAGVLIVDPITNFQWKSTGKEIELTVPANGGQQFWRAIGLPGQKQ